MKKKIITLFVLGVFAQSSVLAENFYVEYQEPVLNYEGAKDDALSNSKLYLKEKIVDIFCEDGRGRMFFFGNLSYGSKKIIQIGSYEYEDEGQKFVTSFLQSEDKTIKKIVKCFK